MADLELPLASIRVSYQGAHCKRCRAAIIWLDTANGSKLAVDPVPTDDGRVEVIKSVGGLVVKMHSERPPEQQSRYRVHVAGCKPRARGWRSR